MNLQDPIETRLRRLPLRAPAPEWRAAILDAARAAASSESPHQAPRIHGLWRNWLQAILWPSPRAWAILAGCWLAALTLQWSLPASDSSLPTASPPTELAQRWQAWQERKRYMAELLRELAPRSDEPSQPVPAPALPPRQTLVEPLQPAENSIVA